MGCWFSLNVGCKFKLSFHAEPSLNQNSLNHIMGFQHPTKNNSNSPEMGLIPYLVWFNTNRLADDQNSWKVKVLLSICGKDWQSCGSLYFQCPTVMVYSHQIRYAVNEAVQSLIQETVSASFLFSMTRFCKLKRMCFTLCVWLPMSKKIKKKRKRHMVIGMRWNSIPTHGAVYIQAYWKWNIFFNDLRPCVARIAWGILIIVLWSTDLTYSWQLSKLSQCHLFTNITCSSFMNFVNGLCVGFF